MQITAFGRNLKALRESHKLTQRALAKDLGITQTSLSSWETRGKKPRQKETVRALCDYFNVSEQQLYGYNDGYYATSCGLNEIPITTVPLLSWAHAGIPGKERILDTVQLPTNVLEAHPQGFFLRIEGSEMNKQFPAGCYVLLDPTLQPFSGCAAAVELDGETVLRKYFSGRNTVMLIADSFSDFPDILTPKDAARIVGVAVWFQSSEQF